MKVKRSIVMVLAALTFAAPATVLAQSERGTITGVIQDATKGMIPGAAVRLAAGGR